MGGGAGVPSRPRVLRSMGISAPLLLGSGIMEESEMGGGGGGAGAGLRITGEDRAREPERASSQPLAYLHSGWSYSVWCLCVSTAWCGPVLGHPALFYSLSCICITGGFPNIQMSGGRAAPTHTIKMLFCLNKNQFPQRTHCPCCECVC